MKKAAFSLKDYHFDKVRIDLTNLESEELDVRFNTMGIYFEEHKTFQLTFEVYIKESEKEDPFLHIQCNGLFHFKNVTNFEEIPDFFYRNSIAILFPYVRAYVSMVTTQANIKGIILPTFNLTGIEKELRKNTVKK